MGQTYVRRRGRLHRKDASSSYSFTFRPASCSKGDVGGQAAECTMRELGAKGREMRQSADCEAASSEEAAGR